MMVKKVIKSKKQQKQKQKQKQSQKVIVNISTPKSYKRTYAKKQQQQQAPLAHTISMIIERNNPSNNDVAIQKSQQNDTLETIEKGGQMIFDELKKIQQLQQQTPTKEKTPAKIKPKGRPKGEKNKPKIYAQPVNELTPEQADIEEIPFEEPPEESRELVVVDKKH